ncbi:MAG: F0F1 ATP synthase subunit delta [Actinomycetota bacterium]|nr:F0F1 ATP synthase subunit delta [Actinomycetota bacterium]
MNEQAIDANITVAAGLDGDLEKKVAEAARRKGASGDIKIVIDPSILGGMILNIGHTRYDFSLRTRLERLADKLKGEDSGS